jgi:hypothetical protein
MDWQPVETAPRDGEPFLCYMDGGWNNGMDFARFDPELEEFVKDGCGWQYVTHWVRIEPPSDRAKSP